MEFYGSREHFGGWRCIFCGEIVDGVIMENRQWLKKGIMPGNRKAQDALGKRGQSSSIQKGSQSSTH